MSEKPDAQKLLIKEHYKVLILQLPKLKAVLTAKVFLWITYPKGTSKVKTDVNKDKIAAFAKTLGLQAISMVSIDETWSALRLKII